MGFNLSSFGAGFASAAVKDMEEERKLAELRGADSVKNMLANYKTVTAENKKREAELIDNIDLLRTYDPTATESQLFALSTKPSVMAAINDLIKKDAFDPASFKLSNFAKVAENNTNATALERVKLLSVLPVVAKTTIAEETPSSGNILRDMLSKSAARSQEKALRQYAQASGIPLERLQAAQGFVSPKVDVAAEIDMSKLRPEKTFSDMEAQAKRDLLKAKQTGNPADLDAASKKLANVVAVNSETSLAGKSEERIQSDMVTEIQRLSAKNDMQGASNVAALLDQRKKLLAKPKDAVVKTDADKISQANLITTAGKTLSTIIAMSLPPGSFITTVNADGDTRVELKDMKQSQQYAKATFTAQTELISRFTDKNGKPRSEMHANALTSAGIGIDKNTGTAYIIPTNIATPEQADQSRPRPSGGGRLGSAGSGRNVAPATAPATAAPATVPAPSLVWDTRTNSWVNP